MKAKGIETLASNVELQEKGKRLFTQLINLD